MIYVSRSTDLTLATLAQMPFMDSVVLAAVAGLPERTAREALRRLCTHGYAGVIAHTRPGGKRVRLFYLTQAGIEELARSRLAGEDAFDLMAKNDMLSAQGREHLLLRLDVVHVVYRVAQAVASAVDDAEGLRFTWRWERQDALEAALRLRDGRSIAISRIGSTHTGRAITDRLKILGRLHRGGTLRTTLLIVPGVVEQGRAAVFMDHSNVDGVHVSIESEILRAAIDSRIWETPAGTTVSAAEALAKTPTAEMPPTRRPEEDPIPPSPDIRDDAGTMGLVATELSTPASSLLRLLYDYPFIRVPQMKQMTGISTGHLTRVKAELNKAGLVHYVSIGRTVSGRKRNGKRVVPSEKGLRYLRTMDRSSAKFVRRFWLVQPCEEGEEGSGKKYHTPGMRILGSKAHGLLKERLHTDGVYAFMAMLMSSCRDSRSWNLLQTLPAHRWERHFKHGRSKNREFPDISRSIRPDATFVLEHPDRSFASFVLEFERSATSPSEMSKKVAPYQHYFAAQRTARDFLDGRPTVLFVYETRGRAGNFASHVSRDGGRSLPILVTSLEDLESAGSVFRNCWLNPLDLDSGYQGLKPLTAG